MAIPKKLKLRKEIHITIERWLQLSKDMDDEAQYRKTRGWVDIMLETTEWTEKQLLAVEMSEIAAVNELVGKAQKEQQEAAVPPQSAGASETGPAETAS